MSKCYLLANRKIIKNIDRFIDDDKLIQADKYIQNICDQ